MDSSTSNSRVIGKTTSPSTPNKASLKALLSELSENNERIDEDTLRKVLKKMNISNKKNIKFWVSLVTTDYTEPRTVKQKRDDFAKLKLQVEELQETQAMKSLNQDEINVMTKVKQRVLKLLKIANLANGSPPPSPSDASDMVASTPTTPSQNTKSIEQLSEEVILDFPSSKLAAPFDTFSDIAPTAADNDVSTRTTMEEIMDSTNLYSQIDDQTTSRSTSPIRSSISSSNTKLAGEPLELDGEVIKEQKQKEEVARLQQNLLSSIQAQGDKLEGVSNRLVNSVNALNESLILNQPSSKLAAPFDTFSDIAPTAADNDVDPPFSIIDPSSRKGKRELETEKKEEEQLLADAAKAINQQLSTGIGAEEEPTEDAFLTALEQLPAVPELTKETKLEDLEPELRSTIVRFYINFSIRVEECLESFKNKNVNVISAQQHAILSAAHSWDHRIIEYIFKEFSKDEQDEQYRAFLGFLLEGDVNWTKSDEELLNEFAHKVRSNQAMNAAASSGAADEEVKHESHVHDDEEEVEVEEKFVEVEEEFEENDPENAQDSGITTDSGSKPQPVPVPTPTAPVKTETAPTGSAGDTDNTTNPPPPRSGLSTRARRLLVMVAGGIALDVIAYLSGLAVWAKPLAFIVGSSLVAQLAVWFVLGMGVTALLGTIVNKATNRAVFAQNAPEHAVGKGPEAATERRQQVVLSHHKGLQLSATETGSALSLPMDVAGLSTKPAVKPTTVPRF